MRRRLRRAWMLGLSLVAGCAFLRPAPERWTGDAEAGALLERIEARRAAVTSMRARARIKAGLAGVWTRQAVLVRRPADVRVDVLSPFGLALALGTDRDLLWIYPVSQGVRYEGVPSAPNLARFLGAPLAVSDLVDILLGVPPARPSAGPPTLSRTADGEWEIVVPIADGYETYWFATDTRELRRAELRRADGTSLSVGFDDYRDGFPWLIEVESSALAQAARLAYDAVERNVELAPTLFEPPPATRVLPLEAATTAG